MCVLQRHCFRKKTRGISSNIFSTSFAGRSPRFKMEAAIRTAGTNCHQTQWGLHRSICSRTDSPPSRCVKPLYWTMFYQHFTMHCFYQFLLMSSIFTRILSQAHLFYAYFTHGPNKSASAQYDNTRGAWFTQEGCT